MAQVLYLTNNGEKSDLSWRKFCIWQIMVKTLTCHGASFVFGLVVPSGQVSINVVDTIHTLKQLRPVHHYGLGLARLQVVKHHLQTPGIHMCLKRSPWGQNISGCIRQMTVQDRLFQ
jgi:hypothetical protein